MKKLSPERWITWALFVGSLGYFMLYFDVGINWMDEGTLLTPEVRILSGQVAYRDFYRIYTPGRWYMFAALFKVFGYNFLVTRIVWAFGHALLAAWIFRLSLRASLKPCYAILPAIAVTLAPGPWQKTPFMLGTIAGIWLVVWYASKPGVKRAIVVGAGTALIFLFRQDAGAFFACVGGLYVLITEKDSKLKSVAGLAAAFLVPTLLWVGLFVAAGAGSELVRQVAFAGAKGFSTNPIPYPGLFDPLSLAGDGAGNLMLAILGRAAYYLPLLVVVGFFMVWFKERENIKNAETTVIWVIVALASILAINQLRARSDFAHLWQAYPVFSLMAAMAIGSIETKKRIVSTAAAVLFLVIVGGAAFSSPDLFHGSARVLEKRSVRYENPKLPVRLTQEEADLIRAVEDSIKHYVPEGEAVFLAPNIPLFYFLSERYNPTLWDVVRPSFLWGDDDQRKAVRLIQEAGTRLVVILEPENLPPTERRFSEYYPILNSYFMTNYKLEKQVADFKFYLRPPAQKISEN